MPEAVLSEAMLKKAAAKWILSVRKSHRIPQSVMESIVSGAQSLFQLALSGVHNVVKQQLTSVPPEVAKDVLESLTEKNQFTQPFLGLETTNKQHQFLKKNFRMVVSVMDLICIFMTQ